MKSVLRVLRFCLWSALVIAATAGALFGYYIYTPAPNVPQLSGTLTKDSIDVGG